MNNGKNNESLSTAEADRVFRLKRVSEIAERVFGNPEKAHRWLRESSIALDGITPIELLETEYGARIVENELGVIDYGMFA